MRPRRRTAHLATALAGAGLALTLPFVTGCGAVDRAVDCIQTADAIADSVTDLQQAVEKTDTDPAGTDDALDAIDRNLGKIGDKADNADVGKAVDDLGEAVDNVRAAIRDGDSSPDLGPVTDAAGELTKVCTV